MRKILQRTIEWAQDNLDPRECAYSLWCPNCLVKTAVLVAVITLILFSIKQ